MKRYVRFDVDVGYFAFKGRGIADPDAADAAGFLKLERVEFDTPEDAEQWREYDEECGGDGTGAVMVHLDELEFVDGDGTGVMPGPNQPALFGEAP